MNLEVNIIELVDEIVELTAQYGIVAYDWDLREEEDLEDYKESLVEILINNRS